MVKESTLVAALVSKSMVASESLAPVLQRAKRLGRPVALVRSAGSAASFQRICVSGTPTSECSTFPATWTNSDPSSGS
jgi:hypothetical protein